MEIDKIDENHQGNSRNNNYEAGNGNPPGTGKYGTKWSFVSFLSDIKKFTFLLKLIKND